MLLNSQWLTAKLQGFLFLVTTTLVGFGASPVAAQSPEEATVVAAQSVVRELVAIPMQGIPRSLLANAEAVAVIPGVIKGSFIIGARHGNGVLLLRSPNGAWYAPAFLSLTGGNVGWQVGLQSTDVILVFKSKRSVENILRGKLTLGADAAIAAGPVGREAAVATDARLGAEIYSYSRSRGVFLGVSIDGSVLRLDPMAYAAFYRSPGPGLPVVVPPSAIALTQEITNYCGATDAGQNPGQNPGTAPLTTVTPAENAPAMISTPAPLPNRADALRSQLADHAPALYGLLNQQWQTYLALPSGVFVGTEPPTPESIKAALANFDAVDTNPQYRALADLPQFEAMHALLRQYVAARETQSPQLNLPPPPAMQSVVPN
jgi:lipid-binding SYLF domain-containing protein